MYNFILISILFLILTLLLVQAQTKNIYCRQSGGLSNIYGHPMFMVNDGLFLDINNYAGRGHCNIYHRYNDYHQFLHSNILPGNPSVNRIHGHSSRARSPAV